MSPKGLTAERIREEWNETDRHIVLKSMVTVCMTGIAGANPCLASFRCRSAKGSIYPAMR